MTRRSVTNDRYRVERQGKTRKSASAAKPKRAAGEASSSAPKKTGSKPRSALGRLFGGGGPGTGAAAVEATPEMKRLTRLSWLLMGVAVVFILPMMWAQQAKIQWLETASLIGYLGALGGSVYLMWGPLRRMRTEAAAAAKKANREPKGASARSKGAGKTTK